MMGDGGTAAWSGCRALRGVEGGLEVGRRDVSDRAVEPMVVEPPHPVRGGQFQILDVAERAVVAHALGLVQTDDRLCECIVETLSG
jgi:hypothetical protein